MSNKSSFNHTEPFVTAFGSTTVRVTPDVASLNVAVSQLEPEPQAAFKQTHYAAQQVRTFLAQANFTEVGSSQVTLEQEYETRSNRREFVGYRARVQFHIVLRDLTRLEELLIGVINAGANYVGNPNFQTSQLKAIRAEVRQEAIAAARAKAALYCEAAGVTLGKVLYIVDENPDQLRWGGHHGTPEIPDDNETIRAFDPSSIAVGGAVTVCFEIIHP